MKLLIKSTVFLTAIAIFISVANANPKETRKTKKKTHQTMESFAATKEGAEELFEGDIDIITMQLEELKNKNDLVANSPFKTEIISRIDKLSNYISNAEKNIAVLKGSSGGQWQNQKEDLLKDLNAINKELSKIKNGLEVALPAPPDGM